MVTYVDLVFCSDGFSSRFPGGFPPSPETNLDLQIFQSAMAVVAFCLIVVMFFGLDLTIAISCHDD